MRKRIENLILGQLEQNLDPRLAYHSIDHTQMVLEAAQFLGREEGLSRQEQRLLMTASVLHDAGFLNTYHEHVEAGCEIAWDLLPKFKYSKGEIVEICNIIRATDLRVRPTTHLEAIMRDADLFYIGTDKFEEFAERLRRELINYGRLKPEDDWNGIEISFLTNQKFYTLSAQRRTHKVIRQNLAMLKQKQLMELKAA